jgi:hypothetical protein
MFAIASSWRMPAPSPQRGSDADRRTITTSRDLDVEQPEIQHTVAAFTELPCARHKVGFDCGKFPDCMLAKPPEEGGAGGTSWSRKVLSTVQIWRPAGFFAVRNTNRRGGLKARMQSGVRSGPLSK